MSAQTAKAQPVDLKPKDVKSQAVGEAIEAWRKSLLDSKSLAQQCAILAITHCYEQRTASQVRRVLEIIENEGKDFVRRAPYTLWLRAYAPVKMVTKEIDGKKTKVLEFDKDSPLLEKQEAMIAAASEKLWWTMSKDREPDAWDVTRFNARMLGLCNQALKTLDADDSAKAEDKAYVRKHQEYFKARVEAAKALLAA